MPKKLVLADDHLVIRKGVRILIDSAPDWEIAGEATNGDELVRLVEEVDADAVLLDLSMPELSGFGVLSRLSTRKSSPGILVFTGSEDPEDARSAMNAGAHGFLQKSACEEELLIALDTVCKKEKYITRELASILAECSASPFEVLTKRETEIAQYIAKGTPNREIAQTLKVSAKTIDSHRYNILKKVGANSNAELTSLAVKHRFI